MFPLIVYIYWLKRGSTESPNQHLFRLVVFESQSLNESGMLTVGPSAVTETAVGSNVIVHSTPIVSQTRVSETDVDSEIQLTPVSTNKNKQPDEMDIMSF